MKSQRLSLWLGLAAVLTPIAVHAGTVTLPIKRVILSSSGLAQIEREGSVDGNAEISLPVPLDQVDDLLKSLAIFDAKGKVESVRLPGKEPLAQAFRSLPFTEGELNSPETLLGALRGAEISISGPRSIKGRIVAVTPFTEQVSDKATATRHRLMVLGENGLESTVLEETQQIEFADHNLQERLDRALAASLDSRAKDQRVLAVNLIGQGSRPVSLAYVISAPIWKTAYRLAIPKQGAKATLQGWAVLENMTGGDWDKVDLSIVSGNPVTFHQALYQSYYVDRPDIPVQVYGRVTPEADKGEEPAPVAFAASAAAPAPRGLEQVVVTARRSERKMAEGEQAVSSTETGAQIAFHFPQPVSVAAGQSLSVPFIGRDIPIERVWLYQPDTNQDHPLTAVRLTNDSDAGLPAGIVTVLEGEGNTFAGDAEFPTLPRSDNRMISFALDQKTFIISRALSDERLFSLKAASGVLHAIKRGIAETIYTIKAPADESRTIIIEHPKRDDYAPEDPAGIEQTATAYRIRVSIDAGQSKDVHVRLVAPVVEDVRIADVNGDRINAWLEMAGKLDNPAAINALKEIAALQRVVSNAQSRVADLDAQTALIVKDQERVRAALTGVPKDSDLAKRYIGTLSNQETDLTDLAHKRATAQQDTKAARDKLNEAIANVQF